MRPTWVCVDVSQNVTVSFAEYAMNFPCRGIRAMQEVLLVSGTSHSETVVPVDASNCLILLADMTKRWLLNQGRGPVLNNGDTCTGIFKSKRPSLLSQTRTNLSLPAVAIRSPCGEYFAAITQAPNSYQWSVRTRSRVAMSQMAAVHRVP